MLPGKQLDPASILKILRRRIWLIAIPPAVTFFAALLYSSTVPDMYQADMLISMDPQRVPDTFVKSTVATLETDRRLDALTVQVLSRTALQEMIKSHDLYPERRQEVPIEDVVAEMRRNISVDLETSSPRRGEPASPSAFHVRFTYGQPEIAAKVTQELGMLFVEQNSRDRGALAGATNKFLESQLSEARKKLEKQESRLEAFRQRYGKELPTQMNSNMQALYTAQLQAQSLVESIARDRDRRQMLDRIYREAVAEPPQPVPTTAAPPASSGSAVPAGASFQQQLATAQAALQDLKLRYKPDHPDVKRGERLVAELKVKAADEAQAATAAANAAAAGANATADEPPQVLSPMDATRRENLRQMRAEIESLDRQATFKENEERRVRAEIAEYQRRIEAVPGLESEWVALTRDYDTEQQAYKDLLAKSTAAQVSANLEEQDIGERFRIVDPAIVPVRPLPAIRAQVNAIGLGLGLLLGLGVAALLEIRDSSFRDEAEIVAVLALPVLATVPRIQTVDEKRRLQWRRWAFSVAGIASLAVASYVAWTLKLWKSLI